MIDWQNLLVVLMMVLAAIYVGKRAWSHLRSLLFSRYRNEEECSALGCGGCASVNRRKEG